MQLINPAIFEKQSADRAKAIEETRLARLKQKEQRQKQKIANHVARFSNSGAPYNSTMPIPKNYETSIDGIRFLLTNGGTKLKRLDGDENAAKLTPKSHYLGTVPFYRSKHGNLYMDSIVKAQRYDLTEPHEQHSQGARLTRSDIGKLA